MQRPFLPVGRGLFQATFRVNDAPQPGCVYVKVTLATRIQLSQEINRRGVKYSEQLLAECSKELVREYLDRGGHVDPDCNPGLSDATISIRYVDFDLLAESAERIARSDEE